VYLFLGYVMNKEVEMFPRLHLVTVEYISKVWGAVYRTGRYTLKKESGAYGVWMPVEVPDLPDFNQYEERALKQARSVKPIKELAFID